MGDLGVDTAVEPLGDGRYRARLSRDWEIWGPMGGYVAAVGLRAAGHHAGVGRPTSFTCHYLNVGAFDEVELQARTVRGSKRTASVYVEMTQGDRPILAGILWATSEIPGLEHDFSPAPVLPHWRDLPTLEERFAAEAERTGQPVPNSTFRFWDNIEERPPNWLEGDEWMKRPAGDPVWDDWFRFRPASVFEDPWLDACRAVVILDVMQWPSANRAYGFNEMPPFIAPSLDLTCWFHRPAVQSEWLQGRGEAPIATGGLVGGRAAVWDDTGALIASGGQQMICRPAPPRPEA